MKLTTNLKNAARAALQWRLLLVWLAAVLLPALLFALPVWSTLSELLNHSVRAPELARALDLVAVTDVLSELRRNAVALQAGALAALALTLLLSPFLTGVITTAGRAQETARFRELFAGGIAEYPRMFRMLLWAIVPLGVALAIGGALGEAAEKHALTVALESDASHWTTAAHIVTVILLLLANLTLDAGRAQLAIDRRRTSAVKAWWWGVKLLLRRPAAMLCVYLVLTVGGLLLVSVLAVARLQVAGSNALLLAAAFVLAQLIALTLAWMRAARLFALMSVSAANR
ncbi:hypothetical protein GM658_08545 [Pseudoduganella eburnea]|uniref:YihY/virulence factor BrkB family protein n=1 Tax=Massilia eburnea TaxID=1776165 RepID=A0A6L6QG76_9BURK|nr:hypothetical protein [Massilia eburnea]MTW10653.1 hypothetical protein [Massilia eburnea]